MQLLLDFHLVDEISCSVAMEFNYHIFEVGPQCVQFGWDYFSQMCTPVMFTLQAFDLNDVMSFHLDTPKIYLNSSSTTFNFPTHIFTDEALFFRIFGNDEEGNVCSPSSMTKFYQLTMLLEGYILL